MKAMITLISVLALGVAGTATAKPVARKGSHPKHAAHRPAHHKPAHAKPAHKHSGIGPGGDLDGDNSGGATDGDGNI